MTVLSGGKIVSILLVASLGGGGGGGGGGRWILSTIFNRGGSAQGSNPLPPYPLTPKSNIFFEWHEHVFRLNRNHRRKKNGKKKKGKSTLRTYFTYKRRAESRHGFLDSALDGACALEWAPPSASLSYLVVLLSEQVWFLWTITNSEPSTNSSFHFLSYWDKTKKKKQEKSCLQKAV